MIGAAKQVAGSTAQLLLACKVKADPDSQPMRRLEDASNAVRKATENLVKAAQSALDNNAGDDQLDLSEGDVGGVVQVCLTFDLILIPFFLLLSESPTEESAGPWKKGGGKIGEMQAVLISIENILACYIRSTLFILQSSFMLQNHY